MIGMSMEGRGSVKSESCQLIVCVRAVGTPAGSARPVGAVSLRDGVSDTAYEYARRDRAGARSATQLRLFTKKQ